MAADIPYMPVVKRVPEIFQKMKKAGTPPKFTHNFLHSHLGFTSSNDRAIIKVLKALSFLDGSARPTDRYNEFKNDQVSGKVLAVGLREGWSDLFLADEQAYKRSTSELTDIFKSVTGKSESVAEKMATTFNALANLADWSEDGVKPAADEKESESDAEEGDKKPAVRRFNGQGRLDEFLGLHHDIHVHLPPTSDTAVYTAIFRALREELID